MSLTTALQTSRTALGLSAAQSALTSRNIAGAGDPTYSQKFLRVASGNVDPMWAGVERAASVALQRSALDATSDEGSASVLAKGLESIKTAFSGSSSETSILGRIGALGDALQTASSQPGNPAALMGAVNAAGSVAGTLRSAAGAVTSIRQQADDTIAKSVDTINDLLQQFGEVEASILRERARGDVTDMMDQRDRILSSLSQEIGITTADSPDGSMAIFAKGGAVLFNREPRSVTFSPSPDLGNPAAGNQVFIDGVDVTSPNSPMRITSGRIAGSIELRDVRAPVAQTQLDEIARGLIQTFAERDVRTPSVAPPIAGLFTSPAAAAFDQPDAIIGLASQIQVNANVDPAKGGNVLLLRDGGVGAPGNPAYTANPSKAPGYTARLLDQAAALRAPRAFDPSSGLPTNVSVLSFAESAIGDAAAAKQKSQDRADQASALKDRAAVALSNEVGVNLDEEMSRLLQIETAYKASTKLISAVDSLYRALFEAV